MGSKKSSSNRGSPATTPRKAGKSSTPAAATSTPSKLKSSIGAKIDRLDALAAHRARPTNPSFRIANAIMTLYFLYATYVQVNDPGTYAEFKKKKKTLRCFPVRTHAQADDKQRRLYPLGSLLLAVCAQLPAQHFPVHSARCALPTHPPHWLFSRGHLGHERQAVPAARQLGRQPGPRAV
ncbi:hypothetical protein BCR44DRAFT_1050810 [Catenaria anguillulae PL171]|uniref:Uncharacterized protein n=1 Tax=Catenaria anguillulae PL171 TaxID=765915 RepID=A0A1Y2HQY5_9FUNG|nr:hypothetical protein BCR44DRAFT_1050810 [Catenaria anguillulae PL171]